MTEATPIAAIKELSIAERILLAEEICDSVVAEQEELEVTSAQEKELDRRLAAYEADPSAGASWEEVKERLSTRA